MKPQTQPPASNRLDEVDVFGHAFRAAVGLLFTGIETGVNSLGTSRSVTAASPLQAVR